MSVLSIGQSEQEQAALLGQSHTTSYLAPKRFDVHTVGNLREWVDNCSSAGHRSITIDASAVRFVDVAAVEAIEELQALHPHRTIQIAAPSMAMTLTLEFLRPASALVGAM